MKKYSLEKTVCPKCGKAYAIPKGSTKAFHCPGRNCHEMVNTKGKQIQGDRDSSSTSTKGSS
jgi:tRNA(Ile2) C34 agmatinyltransferase TiaS